ncbi:MAG: division/cell wall cluster transcriptional repressor MraZ [Candidatus Omnitrophica bacterium]|nr:division/cell wall cluster transcriptional repressor MraZ [Candidatus Omnitrophota bacterium]MBU0878081.1 division/cell wall cluster transcriptional repressor MraZ [Candidatus Omnitrophota bacterium]MBU0896939.1 division/cell wall cluster transcriptional repressor MraZ [Candidatus Omnitrophota bacterium]MBU1134657.1 division/cell wall cluster transcriptional repressor MraZ [Candidatus Omnitrophota bacterium]MBU1366423.1 division/cell wall cluster transcriptional repressor MraZ [Candidatus Om
MWYGEFHHTLDDKDRFILPAKFREKIKTLEEKKFYITRGLDGCLFLFSQSVWNGLEEKLKALPFTKHEARSFNRLYFSGACEVEIDSQGRIILSEYLKEFAAIKREIVIIGVADRIEVWGKEGWNKFYQEKKKIFEETAENLF